MSEHIRTIEVNGVKLDIDLRQAKRIENYKVGDRVKILIKDYSTYKSHVGVIIGFDEFPSRHTMTICYIDSNYNSAEIKFAYFNSASKDLELCPLGEVEKVLDFDDAINKLDSKILASEQVTYDLRLKKNFFIEKYNMHFNQQKEPIK
jgi:hypothetical protein